MWTSVLYIKVKPLAKLDSYLLPASIVAVVLISCSEESRGPLQTYMNMHGPSAVSPTFKIIVNETQADPLLKADWQNWSYKIVDELRRRWENQAARSKLVGDADVYPIKIHDNHLDVQMKGLYGKNSQFKEEVLSCLQSLDNDPMLSLPAKSNAKEVTLWASFAAGPEASTFDSKPASQGTAILGRPCPPGAVSHWKISVKPIKKISKLEFFWRQIQSIFTGNYPRK